MGRVEGKTVLITGAAGGIGRADAALLAREGAYVVVSDIDEERAQGTIEQLNGSGEFQLLDVTSEAAWIEAVGRIMETRGALDGLVNNATYVPMGSPEDATVEEWELAHRVSGLGTFLGCKHAIPAMNAGSGGSIVNMSSVAALRGEWYGTVYGAAKGSVLALTKSVAVYCAQSGYAIRCNTIHPGATGGEDMVGIHANAERLGHYMETAKAFPGTMSSQGNDAGDVANLVLYLISDESRRVNGAEISIDSGLAWATGVVPGP